MDRARRLRELWSWLPAFRAAAETEHLPSAGEAMRVSPSAISRAVKLLEDELGVALFDREGRAMRLNRDGQLLNDALRDAMRILDEAIDGIDPATAGAVRGSVTLAVPAPYAATVGVPAIRELARGQPELAVELVFTAGDLTGPLLAGRIDVGVTSAPPSGAETRTELLAELPRAVYCGSPTATGERAWVDYPGDGWPPDQPRPVAARAPDAAAAAEIAAQTELRAVLPAPIAARAGLRPAVGPAPELDPERLYAVYRRPVAGHRRTEAVVAALRLCAATSASRAGSRG